MGGGQSCPTLSVSALRLQQLTQPVAQGMIPPVGTRLARITAPCGHLSHFPELPPPLGHVLSPGSAVWFAQGERETAILADAEGMANICSKLTACPVCHPAFTL